MIGLDCIPYIQTICKPAIISVRGKKSYSATVNASAKRHKLIVLIYAVQDYFPFHLLRIHKFTKIKELQPKSLDFQDLFQPLYATGHRKPHWNRITRLGEINKKKIGRRVCLVYWRISHNAFEFRNSPKFNSFSQRFETFRTFSSHCRLQDDENRIDIGPTFQEKLIKIGRPHPRIETAENWRG